MNLFWIFSPTTSIICQNVVQFIYKLTVICQLSLSQLSGLKQLRVRDNKNININYFPYNLESFVKYVFIKGVLAHNLFPTAY